MGSVLPDEFPFNKREAPAPTVEESPVLQTRPPQPVAPVAPVVQQPAQPTQHPQPPVVVVRPEPLIEVQVEDRIVYRGPERRRSPRQALRAKAIFRAESKAALSGPVQIMNMSMLGLRFWSKHPICSGDRGAIRMEVGPLKWNSKLRIVSCTSCGEDGYAIGCEFVGNELSRSRAAA
jgi:hypothetical protein